jgi:cytochrome c-type biogenesis protein CcmF
MHIGTLLIVFSLVLSSVLFVLICISLVLKKEYPKIFERLFYASGLLITMAVVLLFAAFLANRFDLSYVYNYSSKDLNIFYKVASFWAGQEGTFLLWVFFLFIFGVIVIKTKDVFTDIVLSVIVLTQIFILIILFRNSPFDYIWQTYNNILPDQIPIDGSGLNPLLQNPWMIIHPPVLFLGYASASIPYAYAIAGLIRKDYSAWILKAYKWVLFCITSLGIGIFLGAYWAYKVLGWGGYWGWDPVENSSLIPWLTTIALMHGLILQKKKNVLVKTNILLAIISLALVFYGTFLTRSGVLSDFSVHSFGDLGLKSYLIFYILLFLLTGVSSLIVRFKNIKSDLFENKLLTENNIISYGIIILLFFAFVILIGTSMPLLSNIFLPNTSAVSEKFYNNISIPFGILIILVLIIATIYRSSKKRNVKNILWIALPSIVLGLLFNLFYSLNAAAIIFSILAFFVIIQNIIDLLKFKSWNLASSRFAHFGIGVLILGIISSNVHSYSIQKNLTKDIETEINSIKLIFKGSDNSKTAALKFIYKNKNLNNEIKIPYYFSSKTNSFVKEPYIDYGLFKDIYIAPVDYKTGNENSGDILISKGEEKSVNAIKIKFIGFDMDKLQMTAEHAAIYVKLSVNSNGNVYFLTPGILIKGRDNRVRIDAQIPHINRKISLLDFDITNKKILLHIEPGKEATVPPDSVIVDISFKRFVWLVWLGMILMSIGGILAVKKQFSKV